MAVGKPVIGSFNGSCANFILHNEFGYVCASQDSEALSNIIKELDINKLRETGKHSREVYFKKYSKEIFITNLIENLILLLSKK